MCSILGYYNSKLSLDQVKSQNKLMSHRGPDNTATKQYIFNNKKLYLSHNRLSIQDLSKNANQPMENDNLVIVFNGEIYNHLELRKECDYNFQTSSDTETLLALFNKYTIEKTLSKLVGMFAIALYEKKAQKLYLMRDVVGIKPIYWTYQDNEFAFSSELKGLSSHLKTKKSNKALLQFMSLGYIPNDSSYYENIYKLKPAHILVFDGNTISIKKYWELPKHKIQISYEEAVEETHKLIKKSIKRQLLSDVEVGSFLSGGIDSSLVSSIMQNLSPTKIKTFTIGFENKKYNESKFAKSVARHINSEHYEHIFKPSDVSSLIDKFDVCYDEPFGDASALPSMLLSKFVKSQVSVSLSGDGGDELFLGYDRYFITQKYHKLFSKIPKSIRSIISNICNISNIDKLEKIAYPLSNLSKQNIYSIVSTSTKPWELNKIFSKEFINESFKHLDFLSIQEINNFNDDTFDNYSKIDFHRYLADDILTKVDRASMMHSLEARVPLLDQALVEFAYSLPSNIKLKNGAKSILKDIAYKYVPKNMLDRPKMGFGVPLKEWFRDELKDIVLDKINALDDRFNKKYIKTIFNKHQKGKNYEYVLWNLMRVAS